MNILFVCHRMPFPPNRGGKIRPFHMIRHLSEKHDVLVASLAESEQELREGAGLKAYCKDLIVEVIPPAIRWARTIAALGSSTPSSAAYFWSPRLHRRIRQAVRGVRLDLIFVHCAFVGRYVLDYEARQRIIDFGDLDSGKWFDYSRHRAFPLSLGFGLEARKLRSYERFLAARFDHCTVTTQGELDEYRTIGVPTTGSVIPNGVDTTYFRQTVHEAGDSSVIAFLGRMNYYPNVDGVLYFAQEVFPLIRQKMPKAVFRIIGSNPTREVDSLANHSGIEVTGSVPDVRPYLKDVALTIAPLRIARGTQNKILESMAMRIPVVATPQAAKGVQAEHGRHLLVASNAHDFADRVVVLLDSPKLRGELAQAAYDQLKRGHMWSESCTLLDRLVERRKG